MNSQEVRNRQAAYSKAMAQVIERLNGKHDINEIRALRNSAARELMRLNVSISALKRGDEATAAAELPKRDVILMLIEDANQWLDLLDADLVTLNLPRENEGLEVSDGRHALRETDNDYDARHRNQNEAEATHDGNEREQSFSLQDDSDLDVNSKSDSVQASDEDAKSNRRNMVESSDDTATTRTERSNDSDVMKMLSKIDGTVTKTKDSLDKLSTKVGEHEQHLLTHDARLENLELNLDRLIALQEETGMTPEHHATLQKLTKLSAHVRSDGQLSRKGIEPKFGLKTGRIPQETDDESRHPFQAAADRFPESKRKSSTK